MLKIIFKLAAMGFVMIAFSANTETISRDLQKEEANRKIVLQLFNVANLEKLNTFIDKFVADDYKQHNPTVADGKEGMRAFFNDMMARHPNQRARVVRVAADGDLVWVHAHLTMHPDDPGLALVDIFRLENGKLVEHWDIMQPVPEEAANDNSMF